MCKLLLLTAVRRHSCSLSVTSSTCSLTLTPAHMLLMLMMTVTMMVSVASCHIFKSNLHQTFLFNAVHYC